MDYVDVNLEMHRKMALNFTGDAEVDFLLGMIPHHEGAVAMCEVYYRYWHCAPASTLCVSPGAADYDVYWQMDHMCNDHILVSQPPEIAWMKALLGDLRPDLLAALEADADDYPCGDAHAGHGDDHASDDGHGGHGGHDGDDAMDHADHAMDDAMDHADHAMDDVMDHADHAMGADDADAATRAAAALGFVALSVCARVAASLVPA